MHKIQQSAAWPHALDPTSNACMTLNKEGKKVFIKMEGVFLSLQNHLQAFFRLIADGPLLNNNNFATVLNVVQG